MPEQPQVEPAQSPEAQPAVAPEQEATINDNFGIFEPPAEPEQPTPTEPEAAPTEEPPAQANARVSQAWNALLERERALTQQQQQLKQSEADLAAFRQLKDQVQVDPAAALAALGFDMGADGEPAAPEPMSEIATLKQELAELRQTQEERSKQIAEQQELHQVGSVIASVAEKAPLIANMAAKEPKVAKELLAYYKQKAQLDPTYSFGQAVVEAEQAQQQTLLQGLEGLLGMGDVYKQRARELLGLGPAPEQPPAQPKPAAAPTLSQALGAEPPNREASELSEDELFEEAVRIMKEAKA